MSVRIRRLEPRIFSFYLLHVPAVFHVCFKVYLMTVKTRSKHVVYDIWMYRVLEVVFTLRMWTVVTIWIAQSIIKSRYCTDRVSYAVQQDTQSVLMSQFYSALMLARHVSDLTGPSSGAFCTSCIRRLWYVVIRVLLDTCSRYKVV